jgi:hypothetical protein
VRLSLHAHERKRQRHSEGAGATRRALTTPSSTAQPLSSNSLPLSKRKPRRGGRTGFSVASDGRGIGGLGWPSKPTLVARHIDWVQAASILPNSHLVSPRTAGNRAVGRSARYAIDMQVSEPALRRRAARAGRRLGARQIDDATRFHSIIPGPTPRRPRSGPNGTSPTQSQPFIADWSS